MIVSLIVFWGAVAMLALVYVVYPLSVPLLGRLFGRTHRIAALTPHVTMIISAYNESAVIAEKLDNVRALDYPSGKLEVFVISDASDDGTDEIVKRYLSDGVHLKRQQTRGGKSRGLTRFVPEAQGEIIVFSDANSIYDSAAISNLVRNFAGEEVGYVVGHQRYAEDIASAAASSEGTFWNFEVWLKGWESRLSSVVGGDGAIYAIRKSLFEPLADGDLSDLVNPLQITVRGYRGVFDPEAFCVERPAESFEGEFRRKVRIVNRAMRGLWKVKKVLNPFRTGWFAYQVWLHKLLRWLTPFFLLLAFVCSMINSLVDHGVFYDVVLLMQLGFIGLMALRSLPFLAEARPIYLAYYFGLSCAAAMVGALSILRGQRFETWRPERS